MTVGPIRTTWHEVVSRTRTPAVVGALVLGAVVLIVGLTLAAVPELGSAELGLDRFLIAHVPPAGTAVAAVIGAALEPAGGAVLLAIVAGVVWYRGDLRRTCRFAVVATVSWLSAEPVKLLVHRVRPVLPGIATDHESWSYPSGHVALVAALVAGLVAVTAGRARARVLAVGSVVVVVVALSRLTLGVHFPSDVVAAAVWSAAVAVVVAALLPAGEPGRPSAGRHRGDGAAQDTLLTGGRR